MLPIEGSENQERTRLGINDGGENKFEYEPSKPGIGWPAMYLPPDLPGLSSDHVDWDELPAEGPAPAA